MLLETLRSHRWFERCDTDLLACAVVEAVDVAVAEKVDNNCIAGLMASILIRRRTSLVYSVHTLLAVLGYSSLHDHIHLCWAYHRNVLSTWLDSLAVYPIRKVVE